LFHRLAVGVLLLPSLREREGDISLLIDALMDKINLEAANQPGYQNKKLSVTARKLLVGHSWPGNIRELNNTLLRASIWAPGGEISAQDVTEALAVSIPPKSDAVLGRQLGDGFLLPDLMGDVARHYLERAMSQAHGNKTEAARLLGLGSYQTLTNWLEKYGVGM
ncbi:MAG: AAA-type ATPase lid domain-containing protein, partial [Thiobacillus sp.]